MALTIKKEQITDDESMTLKRAPTFSPLSPPPEKRQKQVTTTDSKASVNRADSAVASLEDTLSEVLQDQGDRSSTREPKIKQEHKPSPEAVASGTEAEQLRLPATAAQDVKEERAIRIPELAAKEVTMQADVDAPIDRIVEDFDLIIELRVGTPEVVRFGVSEAAVRIACPTWKQELSHYTDRRRIEDVVRPTIELPDDDDPDALRILLYIAHLQFKKVPKSVNYEMLANLAKLCHKYQMKDMLHTTIEGWLKSAKKLAGDLGKVPVQQTAWAGWVFDRPELLKDATVKVMSYFKVDAFSELKGLPPGYQEHVLRNMKTRMANVTSKMWGLQTTPVCAYVNCHPPGPARSGWEQQRGECLVRRAGCAVVMLRNTFHLPLDNDPTRTGVEISESMHTIHGAAVNVGHLAVRPICGYLHTACAANYTAFVKITSDLCSSLEDVDVEMKALFQQTDA